MATERQSPDSLISSTGFSSCVNSDLTSDPDSGDANFCVANSNNVNTETHNSYPTPTGNPTVGVDLQEHKCEVRQFDGGQTATPKARIELWENGLLIRAGTDTDVTSSVSQVIAFTWNANELVTADGSLVEIKVIGTKSGGAPGARNSVDVGGVEWNVDFTVATAEDFPSYLNPVQFQRYEQRSLLSVLELNQYPVTPALLTAQGFPAYLNPIQFQRHQVRRHLEVLELDELIALINATLNITLGSAILTTLADVHTGQIGFYFDDDDIAGDDGGFYNTHPGTSGDDTGFYNP